MATSGAAPPLVGIRFQKLGKVYHFDATGYTDLVLGDFVVVSTKRGRQLGQVVQVLPSGAPPPSPGPWAPIERRGTPVDLVLQKTWQKKELEVTINCRAAASEMGLKEIKIVASEFSFDGANLTVLYSVDGEEKYDPKKLRRMVAKDYPEANIDMRLIGPRDVASILGGMGACGLETRCCSKFITDFSPVSIKMAKAQGISLNPTEITGMCGRLRCCLVYEYEQYGEARKTMPKRNKRVVTPLGEGKVVDVFPLKQAVLVYLPEQGVHEFLKHEIEPWDELEALRRKAESPCDRHENGGCDCGKAPKERNND